MFFKICVAENFAKPTGKNLCWSLFLIKLQTSSLQLCQNGTPAQVFSHQFCEISSVTFFKEYLQEAASSFLTISKLARMLQILAQRKNEFQRSKRSLNPSPKDFF